MKECNHIQCEICKIFSNPHRLEILLSLRDGPKTVSEIIKQTHASQSVVSQHLSMMKARGILETERRGAFILYKLRYKEIMDAFDIMRAVSIKTMSRQ